MGIKLNKKIILKYISLFFIMLILANAEVLGISPFLFAFFFACLYVGFNEKFLGAGTIVCSFLINPNLNDFFVALTVVFVGLVLFYVHKFIKKRIRLYEVFCALLISLITFIYYNHNEVEYLCYYLFLSLLSLFIFIQVLQVIMLRRNCFKLTLDESVCFMFAVALFGLGLAPIQILNIAFYRTILMLTIFICVSVGSPTLTYSLTIAFSFGVSLGSFSLIPIGEFVVLALLCGMFTFPNRFKMIFIVVLSDVFLQYFFLMKSWAMWQELIPILIAGLIFLLISNKTIQSLSDLIYIKKSEITSRNLINTTRKNIRKRMSELSNIFLDMKNIHLNLVKKELTKENVIAMFTREVMSSCCKDCLDKNRCTRSIGSDNKSNLETLIEVAVTKGKITLLDIPAGLSNRCGKVNNLIGLVNRLNNEFRQYKSMMADVNNVKILLADQMGAVSHLLLTLGDEIDTNVKFDIARENKIISRLLSQNIHCKEVLLYTEKNDEISAVLIVKSENVYDPIIEKVVAETVRCPMQLVKVNTIDEAGYSSVVLKKKGKYDCVFGLASCNKSGNEESGDCHSIIRLAGDRFLLALCDGMGAGRSAHNISAVTLGLIENFYKVGFDNDIILESVNKLLAINNQESYSTLDVCLLDLEKEMADFIKVGAPFGLVKRNGSVEIVEGGSLPIGALDNISPTIKKLSISTKDIVVMATDGITDAFGTEENMIEFVEKLVSTNPQTLAETILNEALERNKMSAKDDMTVLVARTYLKNQK